MAGLVIHPHAQVLRERCKSLFPGAWPVVRAEQALVEFEPPSADEFGVGEGLIDWHSFNLGRSAGPPAS
jgi:hypothetical protein